MAGLHSYKANLRCDPTRDDREARRADRARGEKNSYGPPLPNALHRAAELPLHMGTL
jgi:hypothetical protein